MFQVHRSGAWIGYAGSIGGAREIVRCEPPGCYDVDEIRAESLASGIRSRRWGHLIRHPDGRIEDEQYTAPDR
jgi:hypothetical protein